MGGGGGGAGTPKFHKGPRDLLISKGIYNIVILALFKNR